MRSLFYLSFVLLLLVQCKKSSERGPSGAMGAADNYCANCASVRFYITLTNKNTGGNYLLENKVAVTDIEVRNALNQLISSSNISVAFPDDLKGAIIFPMPDRSRFFLKVKPNILLEVSYSSKLGNTGKYEISDVKVKDHGASSQKVSDGYLLSITI
ncbi:hypothetical protein [Niabella aurantiaca]|uniref:hypothetical protein n=1 Tax=Niabella aurantiaca TaxID=379900 RepID=UPI0012F7DFA1|nr:hypothetical protein [Niabella aurantiaca]